jgi:nucleoside 2-deoxyribosyltransferase
VLAPRQARYYGQARWDELRSSFVAVFDWRSYQRIPIVETRVAGHSAAPDIALAAIAYELGLALTLGKPVIIVGAQHGQLPFDVDIDPVRLSGDRASDAELIADAIDDTMYGVQRPSDESNLAVTLDQLSALATETGQSGAIEGMGWLNRDNILDPVAFNAAAQQVVRRAGRGKVLTPTWPSNKRAGLDRALFHVTPFSSDWSDVARGEVRAACRKAGVQPVDGENVQDARILQRVWDGISGADMVLVDITDLNANVMIELGMAHALGRPTQIVQKFDGRNRDRRSGTWRRSTSAATRNVPI